MRTSDYFYPGFEYAGFETPVDHSFTALLCALALAAVTVRDVFRDALGMAAPLGEPVFDA